MEMDKPKDHLQDGLPVIPEELLKALERLYPERCPDPQWNDRDIWIRVGERRVVRHLRRVFEEQNENILSGYRYVSE